MSDLSLFDSVQSGNLELVKEALANCSSDEFCSSDLLKHSLQNGFKSIAKLLISDKKFDANSGNGELLEVAIELGYLDIAKELLEKGANPNFRNSEENSVFLLALEHEYFDLAEFMLKHGAEVNIRNKMGWTCLVWASIKGYEPIVDFLINHNADINICNDDGWNALTGALFKNHTGIINKLQKQGARFSRKYNEAALISSFNQGYMDTAKSLIEQGCSVNVINTDGQPLLISAIIRGDKNFVQMLIDNGADVNCDSGYGNSALIIAMSEGAFEIADLLIDAGAVVNKSNKKNGLTALMYASKSNKLWLVKKLLEHGSQINKIDDKKKTALIYAAMGNHTDIKDYLIKKGADETIKDIHDKDASDYGYKFLISSALR